MWGSPVRNWFVPPSTPSTVYNDHCLLKFRTDTGLHLLTSQDPSMCNYIRSTIWLICTIDSFHDVFFLDSSTSLHSVPQSCKVDRIFDVIPLVPINKMDTNNTRIVCIGNTIIFFFGAATFSISSWLKETPICKVAYV